jgi:hypothetical protein
MLLASAGACNQLPSCQHLSLDCKQVHAIKEFEKEVCSHRSQSWWTGLPRDARAVPIATQVITCVVMCAAERSEVMPCLPGEHTWYAFDALHRKLHHYPRQR